MCIQQEFQCLVSSQNRHINPTYYWFTVFCFPWNVFLLSSCHFLVRAFQKRSLDYTHFKAESEVLHDCWTYWSKIFNYLCTLNLILILGTFLCFLESFLIFWLLFALQDCLFSLDLCYVHASYQPIYSILSSFEKCAACI